MVSASIRRGCCRTPTSRSNSTKPEMSAAACRRSASMCIPNSGIDRGRTAEVLALCHGTARLARNASTMPASLAVRRASPPAAAPASNSSPTTPRNSCIAGCARAIRAAAMTRSGQHGHAADVEPRPQDFVPYSPAGATALRASLAAGSRSERRLPCRQHPQEGISPFDDLQPPYAALISGAFHPTAEGHAIVADHVLRHVNELLAKRSLAAAK